MAVWLVAGGAVLLWVVASVLVVRSHRRQGRSLREGELRREVDQMFGSPDEIARRMEAAPSDPAPAIRHAREAEAAGDWAELELRAELLIRRFPGLMFGHLALARACWQGGQEARARRLVATARRRFPEVIELQEMEILQARAARSWRRAARLGAGMRREHPMLPNGYVHEAASLLEQGRIVAASKVIRLAERDFPEQGFVADLWSELEKAEADGAGRGSRAG